MVIRMRHTRSHTKNRRSHHALKDANLSVCSHCGASHRPHHMCLECGYYNDRQIMDIEAEKVKRNARIQAKKEVIHNELAAATPDAPVVETKEETKEESKKKEAKDTKKIDAQKKVEKEIEEKK